MLRRPEALFFGAPQESPHPCFPFPEREWSAGRRQDACEAPFGGPLSGVRRALTAMAPLPEVAASGAREPTDGGPCASRRSTAAALRGRRALPPLPIITGNTAVSLDPIEMAAA